MNKAPTKGPITVPAPPEAARPAFDYYLLDIRDDRWLSTISVGWPSVLAIGVALGVPWLINPLLSAAAVLLGYDLVRRFLAATIVDDNIRTRCRVGPGDRGANSLASSSYDYCLVIKV